MTPGSSHNTLVAISNARHKCPVIGDLPWFKLICGRQGLLDSWLGVFAEGKIVLNNGPNKLSPTARALEPSRRNGIPVSEFGKYPGFSPTFGFQQAGDLPAASRLCAIEYTASFMIFEGTKKATKALLPGRSVPRRASFERYRCTASAGSGT